MKISEMLAEFHAALGDERGCGGAGLRLALHAEEHGELELELRALRGMELEGEMHPTDDELCQLARELADVVYIAFGTAHVFAIDLDVALAEIHRAAMSKLYPDCSLCDGAGNLRQRVHGTNRRCPACEGTGKGKRVVRGDGKICKPEGFVPPDMSAAIKDGRRAGA